MSDCMKAACSNVKYDGFLFGNGLTISFQQVIRELLEKESLHDNKLREYFHEIYFTSFVDSLISGKLSERETNRLKRIFKEKSHYSFSDVKKEVSNYWKRFDGNEAFEFLWGKVATDVSYYRNREWIIVRNCMPVLYNFWYSNLMSLIRYYEFLSNAMKLYNQSVRRILSANARIYTTNFDGFFDDLNPSHLHGKFVESISTYSDLIYKRIGSDVFLYPFIWAPSEYGKMEKIEQISKYSDHAKFFDFGFFHEESFEISSLLIYGLSFSRAGYMCDMEKFNPKYARPSFGSCIDDHILCRLKTLSDGGRLGKITFAAYSTEDEKHFVDLVNEYEFKNAEIISSTVFDFGGQTNA